MEQPKILIVDDDQNICELIRVYLEDEFRVVVAYDGSNIENLLNSCKPDLILLDVMLPGRNGFEICKEIRSKNGIPIIFLSAKGEETDKVLGLEFGADDYITKPFSPREMLARVKAVLRRFKSVSEGTTTELTFPKMQIDPETRAVKIDGQLVELTPKEFDILLLMARNPGRVFTREQLLDQVWGYDYVGETRAVDSHIKRIRQKLEKIPNAPDYLHTVWGLGYKFEVT